MKKIITILLVFVLCSLFLLYILQSTRTKNTSINYSPVTITSTPPIFANAAIIYDPEYDMIVFERNAHIPLPIASITKIMTAYVALKYLPDNHMITITAQDLLVEGNSGLRRNEVFTKENLVGLTLLISSNDGAGALGRATQEYVSLQEGKEVSFISLMNKEAHMLGLVQTGFLNSVGLDETPILAGAYSSAYDVALLLNAFYKAAPDIASLSAKKEYTFIAETGEKHDAVSTNIFINEFDSLLVSKTGFTDLAGGNFASLLEKENGNPIVLVALGSTKERRFQDVLTLFDFYSTQVDLTQNSTLQK